MVGWLENKRIPGSDRSVGEVWEDYDGGQSEVKRECFHVVSIQLAGVAVVWMLHVQAIIIVKRSE
jgi:hypothetical protein